ncbi:ferredoxin reductase [Nocardioides lianchengensis]|jgi:ferredoxin-NADP reductase|uniref:Ferredoxin-NADP reductase n=1 Tax=Nocardioides lianchengensis TaxID=1045774 RepID=A0A1G6XC89_9ACTN|nr:ferredoxin reductase [Nocardioides lianchengensis]NYG09043.1 ferredoxin-NADP reductase [Nocardioides lianchengensis]SDD74896.1 Ferredoxin-NADP reductase [Nocardioides lianchengensis]
MSVVDTVLRSRALAALTSPHGVDRYLELVNPMWAAHEVRARIVDVTREVDVPGHPPVATLTLQPTATWRGHRAGQHVQVGVEVEGARRTTRVFTISSSDSRPGERFTITLRANPGGVVSRWLVEQASPGTMLHLSQAQGEFVLPDRVPEHVLMISGGSGITPVMSMLRSLQRRTHRGRITFLHYAQSPAHLIFAAELDEVRRSGHGVDVHLLHPEHGDPNLSPAYLERLVPGYRDVPTWACGPTPLMEAVLASYDGSDALRTEWFRPPRVSTGASGGEVVFARSGRTVPNSGAPLLEQAEAAGLTPASGCRMGICFSCVSRKTEGTVRDVVSGEESSLPDEDVRICVSAPVGDCTVDL